MTKLPPWSKKLPKKVTICGRVYRISRNMLGGASFDCDDAKIIIGCIGPYAEAIDSLVHEISEIVHVMGGTRFYNGGRSSELIFVTDHAKFQNHNMMLVAALIDCGLLK